MLAQEWTIFFPQRSVERSVLCYDPLAYVTAVSFASAFGLLKLVSVKGMNCMSHRAQYRRDAQAAYQQKMLAAHTGKGDYPKIRTFSHTENSTNSVYKDIEAAERLWVKSSFCDAITPFGS